jgi:hypothetical protein
MCGFLFGWLGSNYLEVKPRAATPLHDFIHVAKDKLGDAIAPQPSFVAMYLHLLTLAVLPPHDADAAVRGLGVVLDQVF